MKKVGIITLQGNNYGAVLQAYALNKVINDLGYIAENIDYNDPHRVANSMSLLSRVKHDIWNVMYQNLFGGRIREHKFEDFRVRNIRMSSKKWESKTTIKCDVPEYDIYVSGSDQIWNPKVINEDYSYLLDFVPEGKKRISYASSFGISKLPAEYEKTYQELLAKYSFIGVRERSGKEIINHLLPEKKASVVLDPTLLLSRDEWRKLAKVNDEIGPYILCYHMPGDKKITDAIFSDASYLSKKYNMKTIHLGLKEYNRFNIKNDCRVTTGPEDFVSLFLNAEIVLTNSFHGTVFAANFGKKLISYANDTGSVLARHVRITDFLKFVGADDAICYVNCESGAHSPFDTVGIQDTLDKYRNESKAFLEEALKVEN